MAVLIEGDLLFLHVPKTGGSWITHCLEKQDLIVSKHIGAKHADLERTTNFWRHYPYLYLRKTASLGFNIQSRIRGSYKFCFVRHPYNWVKSFYRFMDEKKWPKWGGLGSHLEKFGNTDWHPNRVLYDLSHETFNTFLKDIVYKTPGYVHEMYSWYTGRGIDFVGRKENIVDGLISVLDSNNISFDEAEIRNTEPVNVSCKKNLEANSELVRKFHMLEYPALFRYGYDYPSFIDKINI